MDPQLTNEAQIAVLREQVRELREEVKNISRNMWGVVLACAGMLGKFVLDRIDVSVEDKAQAAAAMAIRIIAAILT